MSTYRFTAAGMRSEELAHELRGFNLVTTRACDYYSINIDELAKLGWSKDPSTGDWLAPPVAAEDPSREAIVTDSEKVADQMRQDILGGKIDKAGRQVVRDACDKMDAPKAGRDAANDALGKISNRGGFW